MKKLIERVTYGSTFRWLGSRFKLSYTQCRDPKTVYAERLSGPLAGLLTKLPFGTEVDIDDPQPANAPFFQRLRQAVTQRKPEWFRGLGTVLVVAPSFRAMELGGEAGEVLNAVKKLERHRLGMVGGTDDTTNLSEELGDVIICCELIAREYDIDLEAATCSKFNKTSDKHGFKTKL